MTPTVESREKAIIRLRNKGACSGKRKHAGKMDWRRDYNDVTILCQVI